MQCLVQHVGSIVVVLLVGVLNVCPSQSRSPMLLTFGCIDRPITKPSMLLFFVFALYSLLCQICLILHSLRLFYMYTITQEYCTQVLAQTFHTVDKICLFIHRPRFRIVYLKADHLHHYGDTFSPEIRKLSLKWDGLTTPQEQVSADMRDFLFK